MCSLILLWVVRCPSSYSVPEDFLHGRMVTPAFLWSLLLWENNNLIHTEGDVRLWLARMFKYRKRVRESNGWKTLFLLVFYMERPINSCHDGQVYAYLASWVRGAAWRETNRLVHWMTPNRDLQVCQQELAGTNGSRTYSMSCCMQSQPPHKVSRCYQQSWYPALRRCFFSLSKATLMTAKAHILNFEVKLGVLEVLLCEEKQNGPFPRG